MKTVHVDGGAFPKLPDYTWHDAYFSVVDSSGELIHFAKNIGDFWSGLAEYKAIEWAINNIPERPLRITSDCTTAIAWIHHGGNLRHHGKVKAIALHEVEVVWLHNNLADQWNARNHSPKKDTQYYFERWVEAGRPQGKNPKHKKRKTNVQLSL